MRMTCAAIQARVALILRQVVGHDNPVRRPTVRVNRRQFHRWDVLALSSEPNIIAPMPPAPNPSKPLPRTVVVIGLVSLLNDFASEMVTPLIPLLLVTVLAAGPLALGLIEGLADTTTNLLKLWAGRRSDRDAHRRKPFVLFGYALSNLVRPLIGLSSGSWLMVLGIRVTDRVGKGLRTAPRDACSPMPSRTGWRAAPTGSRAPSIMPARCSARSPPRPWCTGGRNGSTW